MTLHDVLLACGFTHEATNGELHFHGRRHIVDGDRRIVMTGTADETWSWLHDTHDIQDISPKEPS